LHPQQDEHNGRLYIILMSASLARPIQCYRFSRRSDTFRFAEASNEHTAHQIEAIDNPYQPLQF